MKQKRSDPLIEYLDDEPHSETLREVVGSPVIIPMRKPVVPKVRAVVPKPKRREVQPWETDEVLAERDRRVGEANRRWFARYGYPGHDSEAKR